MSDTPTPEQPDIHDLMHAVRNHPDYVWGTVFTWADVEAELDTLRENGDVPEALTSDELADYSGTLGKTLEIRCMEVSHWSEGLADAIMGIAREDFPDSPPT